MRVRVLLAATVLFGLGAPTAFAASHDVLLYSYKDWDVRAVTWDDGTSSCVAEITYDNGDSFAVWDNRKDPIRLQFYSPDWDFGSKDSCADIQMQIDGHNSWGVTNADFYKNSVLIDLPGNSEGQQFLLQVAGGNRLYLYDDKGKQESDYSLSGSRASINALTNCVSTLH